MKYLLKSGTVWSQGKKTERDIYIDGDRIAEPFSENEADLLIDLSGQEVFPGFVDLHCHLREPGYSNKETVATGTIAAAKGGFTTVVAMPNTSPVLDTPWEMENYLKYLEEKAVIRVLPVAPLTKGREGKALADLGSLKSLGVKFASDDGSDVQDAFLMRSALAYAADHDMTVLSHAEIESLAQGSVHEGYLTRDYGIRGISSTSESVAVARNLLLAKEVGARIHFCHLSTKESVSLVKLGKEMGVQVTAEVTPHHLYFTDLDVVPFDTAYKVNPPIREPEDRDALKKALLDGTIDAVATDHAPHTEDEKARPLDEAPFGISSIEVAASIVYTCFQDTTVLYEKLCKKPYEIIGEKNELEVGDPSDLTVFNPRANFVVSADSWASKGKNSPYFGRALKGRVTLTIQGGRIVYEA